MKLKNQSPIEILGELPCPNFGEKLGNPIFLFKFRCKRKTLIFF